MATHDIRCTACGYIYRDVNISVIVGARAYCRETFCTRCGATRGMTLEPVPAIRLSLFSDGVSTSTPGDFTKSTTQVEDPSSPSGYREVTVGSLHDIRRLERESEQAERNGEGRKMVWRDYSQDHSNQFIHTLGEDPSLKPAKRFTNGTPVVSRKGDAVVADHGAIEE
jgi:hypothetical protein